MTQNSTPPSLPPPKEEDLPKVLTSIADLIPHSYREKRKRLMTYLTESQHFLIDTSGNEVIINVKTYILLDLLSGLTTNRKRSVLFYYYL